MHKTFVVDIAYVLFACSTWIASDCYVGLYREAHACSCRGFSNNTCEACRAEWAWYDDTPMVWWNWQSDEPSERSCGRISTHSWAANDCSDELRYVCQRGK